MTELSDEALALIDRLKQMDPANPRQDKSTIEAAITAHLKALDLPARPLVWADDARKGYGVFIEGVMAAGTEWDTAVSASLTIFGVAAWNATTAACSTAVKTAWDVARITTRTEASRAVWFAACPLAEGWAVASDAAKHAAEAVARVNGLAAFDHPSIAKLVDISLPMLDAFEAGLFFYWITPDEVICTLQPTMSIQNGHLHRVDGPAVAWPSGEAYHFWRGVQVPAWVIEKPHEITVKRIRAVVNQEIRRCMTEIYGLSRYLHDARARLVHEDEFGRLWETKVGAEVWRIVEVMNGTEEPDGSRHAYTLDVTDAAKILGWPIDTARAAVAATYGLRPMEYCPDVRT